MKQAQRKTLSAAHYNLGLSSCKIQISRISCRRRVTMKILGVI